MDGQVRFRPRVGDTWPAVEAWTRADWRQWLLEHNRFPLLHPWTAAEASQYLQVDRYTYGVGLKRRAGDPLTWFYLPGPQAVALHASKVPNLLYGGAAGGMKSHAARWDAYRHCLAIPGFRAILMRREFEQLRRNHLDKARSECARINAFLDADVMRFMESNHEIVFTGHPKGQESKIIFGHCQRVGDEEAYLGDEYDAFYPDEMSTFEKSQIVGVAGRLRSTKPGLVARLIGTSNPGGAHTLWIKRWFIDRVVEPDEHPRYKADQYAFIPAMLYDNPYLMDPDGSYTTYEDRLYAYDDERRRQLLHGDWSALAGQFFPEFSADTHVQALDLPPGCKIERWIDWGYDPHPGVCHWVAALPNGRLYVFYEWKFNGKTARQKLVAGEVARHIKRLTDEEVLKLARATRITKTIADPSMFSVSGHTGESYAETFARHGVPLRKGDNERVMGWGRLRHWFRPAPDGHPWILYHPRCAYAIRTIPSLVRDSSDADDVETTGEDHAADCFLAETRIRTPAGERPLIALRVHDLVETRAGPRRVQAVFSLGVRPTRTVTLTSGRVLTGTTNHPIWVEGQGWTPLGQVHTGDCLHTPTSIDASRAGSGGPPTVPSRAAGRFTIAMAIQRITTSRIWTASPRKRTAPVTHNPTRCARVGCAIARWWSKTVGVFAPPPVSRSGVGALAWTMWCFSASDAPPRFAPIGTMSAGSVHAPAAVGITSGPSCRAAAATATAATSAAARRSGAPCAVASVRTGPQAEVFNVTVEGEAEYFAEGILVHNCDRYGVMDRPTPTVFTTKAAVIPKDSPAGMIKELKKQTGARPAGMVA